MSLLLKIARRPEASALVGLCFAWFHRMLPVRRVCETDRVLAFHHPRPSWTPHVLLVPKRRVPTLPDLTPALLTEIIAAAGVAAEALGLTAYTLCANGGPRQEVKQVHFHLFAGENYITDAPEPQWEVHLRIGDMTHVVDALGRLRAAVQDLDRRGYTLVVYQGELHLIAGRRKGP